MKLANQPTLYLNIPATSPDATSAFFKSLNFSPIEQYSDALTKPFFLPAPNTTVCVMVHAYERFKEFVRPSSAVVDAKGSSECLFAVEKKDVDEWLGKAVEAGGTADPCIMKNHGADCGMYTRSFADFDRHIWEVVAMMGMGCPGESSS